MKIGVSSYSFQTLLKCGMTYFEVCQHARDMGYDGIEFIDLDLAFAPGEDNVESLAKHLRAHCEALDLDIPAYTVAADFLNGRGGAPEDEPARVCRCADIAALLGAKVLRHDAFWRLGELRDWREGIARVVPGIRQVADYAQSLGIRTCTENHGRILQDSDRVEYLMRAVDHPNYGWLVDMGNFMCADETPVASVAIAAPRSPSSGKPSRPKIRIDATRIGFAPPIPAIVQNIGVITTRRIVLFMNCVSTQARMIVKM